MQSILGVQGGYHIWLIVSRMLLLSLSFADAVPFCAMQIVQIVQTGAAN